MSRVVEISSDDLFQEANEVSVASEEALKKTSREMKCLFRVQHRKDCEGRFECRLSCASCLVPKLLDAAQKNAAKNGKGTRKHTSSGRYGSRGAVTLSIWVRLGGTAAGSLSNHSLTRSLSKGKCEEPG